MFNLKKILVPIDFGDSSMRALDVGRQLADACGASLHLLHVIPYPLGAPETEADLRQQAFERLDALLDASDRGPRRAAAECTVGTPNTEIARYASDHDIDLIIMGTHSHGPTFQMGTGSIAESIMGLAPCAVLAIKSKAEAPYSAALDPASAPAPQTTS